MADKRLVRLNNPRDPSRPFARVENKRGGVRWASCNSTGRMGGGGGGGGSGGPSVVRTVHLVFRASGLSPAYANQALETLNNARSAYRNLLGGGAALTVASLAAFALGFVPAVFSFAGGLIFLASGMVTMTFTEFYAFVMFDVQYVVFTKPCGAGEGGR